MSRLTRAFPELKETIVVKLWQFCLIIFVCSIVSSIVENLIRKFMS